MKTLLRLSKFALPVWGWVLLAVLLGALTIGASVGLLATSAYLISAAALHPSIAELQVAIVGVRFFGISRGVFRYLERLVSHGTTFRLLSRLRVWFYHSVEPLAPARLISLRGGDLLARATADIETLEHFFVRVLAPPIVAVLIITCMAFFLASFDPRLSIALLVFLLLIGLGLTALSLGLGRRPGRGMVERGAVLRAGMVDCLQGLPDLLAHDQAEAYLRRMEQVEADHQRTQRHMARISGLQSGLNALLTGLGVWVVLVLALPLTTSGQLDGSLLAVVVLAAMASFEAVQGLPLAAQYLESNRQAAERLFDLADDSPAVSDPPGHPAPPDQCGLSIQNLTFAYTPSDPPALQDINLDLSPGRHVAIVGSSGAGKTTLVNLLLRFWEFQEGEVLLGGRDIRGYTQEDVRGCFSVVPQRSNLFNTSLRENLLLAKPSATEEEIVHACRQSELHEFIQSLPQGYETRIGEHGLQLSGGERQRVAIAQALLRQFSNLPFPAIFIFDEPTANLDALTERRIITALQRLSMDHSALWITHRLVGLQVMDEILVLESGRVIERGTHDGLLKAGGMYRRMWDLQNRILLD